MLNGLVARLPASSSVSTIQTLNATGTVTAWNSTIQIGATALTANIVITLPTVVGNTGKLITFQRIDNTAFTVTIVANGAEILTLPSFASELQLPNGTITIQAIDATNARQVSNIGVSPTIAEFGEAFPSTATVVTTLAPQDYIFFTLPTIGVWEIETTIRSATTTTGGVSFLLSDNSNVTLANSEGKSTFANSTNTQGSGSTTYRITVTVPNSIYKCRVFSDGTVGSSATTDPNGRSSVKYKKIAGFTPVLGTTIDGMSIIAGADQTTALSVGSPVLFPSPIITGGGNITQLNGVFTLPANKSFLLEGGIVYTNGTELIYRWRNITTNTLIGQTGDVFLTSAGREPAARARVDVSATPVTVRLEIISNTGVTNTGSSSDGRGNWATIIQVGSSGFNVLGIANGGTGSNTQSFVDLTTNQTINGIKTFNNTTVTTANEFNIIDASLTTGAPVSIVSTSIAKLTGFKGESIIVNGALTTASQTTVGLGIANTHTGSAETNVGLQVDANGATNNYGIIVPTGLVGIGTSTPTSTLQVSGSISTILNTVTAAAYTALASDYAIRLTLVGNQVLTLPTPISCPGRSYLISNPTGYLKSFAASVIGVDGIATTLIISNCNYIIQSDGVNFNIISGIKAHTATKLFVAGALTTGSLIVGGVEFSLTTAATGATCFLQARLVGLPATRTCTSIVSRDSHQAATSIVGEILNPSLTTTYQNLNTATTALANAYLTDIYVLNDRNTGERWDIILSSDGSNSGLLFVRYVAP